MASGRFVYRPTARRKDRPMQTANVALDLDKALLTPADVAMASNGSGARDWVPYEHLVYLNERITEALATPGSFLAVELPVRHGKSMLTTVSGGAWCILTWPEDTLMVAGHTAPLVRRFGRAIRSRVTALGKRFGVEINRRESSAANEFALVGREDPAFIGVPVGGTPTGAGAKRIIIDDPVRDGRDVATIEKRDALWEWYTETLRSRLAPGGSIVLVMSRWHEDDLIGRLFNPAYATGDPWERVHLPALATDEDDPLGREIGEALCPEMFDEEALAKLAQTLGPATFAANFQGDPITPTGDMFKADKWGTTSIIPAGSQFVRWWDNAATEGGTGARTAGVLLAATPEGRYIVVDAVYGRWNSATREARQRATAIADAATYPRVTQGAEQEPGSGGKDQARLFVTKVMAGMKAVTELTNGASKEVRAETWAAQQQAGYVDIYTPGGTMPAWAAEFLEEHKTFPRGTTKDMVDAASHAFNWVALNRTAPSSTASTSTARRTMRRT